MEWLANRSAWWVVLAAAVVVAAIVIYVRRVGRTDIRWPEFTELDWGANATEASLRQLYAYVVGFSNSSIAWYQSRRRPKRSAGFMLRAGALVATVIAGLVPL